MACPPFLKCRSQVCWDVSVYANMCVWVCVCGGGVLSLLDSGGLVWLLALYVLATSKVISGQLLSCDSVHSWRLKSVAPWGNQAADTMTQFFTQSYYPDTELTSPNKCWLPHSEATSINLMSFVWLNREPIPRSSAREARALPIWLPCPFGQWGMSIWESVDCHK